jgi:hypothetical protein
MAAEQEFSLPVARYGPVLDLCRSLADRYRIDDASVIRCLLTENARSANTVRVCFTP